MPTLDRVVAGLTCRQVLADLSAFLDGETDESRVGAMREHLAGCRECDRFGAEMASVLRLLRERFRTPPPVDRGTAVRLRARLRAEGILSG